MDLSAFVSSFSRGCADENYTGFIKLLFEFVDKMMLVFRKYDAKLRDAREKLVTAVGLGHSKEVVHLFMDAVGPHKEVVLRHDESAINLLVGVPVFADIDLLNDWPKLSNNVKSVIWNYLGSLLVAGNKCIQCEQVFAPLQNTEYTKNLLETTMARAAEFEQQGNKLETMEDAMKLAKQIHAKMNQK